VPRVVVGNSFAVPPAARPLPRFRWWSDGTDERARMAETEERATRNSNAVLKHLHGPPIRQVSDLFEAEATFLCARPELDVYGARDRGTYVGPINSLDLGADPAWPVGAGARVFAYVKPGYKHFEALLNAMARGSARYLVFAPGIPEKLQRQHAGSNVAFSATPLRMRVVAKECDAVICHAGGVTDVALAAGKPLLLLPMQMEQTMTSHRVAELGAGLFLPIEGNPANLSKLVKQLTGDPELAMRAQEFSRCAAGSDQDAGVAAVVEACAALLT